MKLKSEMERNTMSNESQPLVRLRVLTKFDKAYGVFVARCLETGHVVTADSAETADEMIKELLQDEISYAVEHQNFQNLFSTPAPFDVWASWLKLANKRKDRTPAVLKIDAKELRLDDHGPVPTEIDIANA